MHFVGIHNPHARFSLRRCHSTRCQNSLRPLINPPRNRPSPLLADAPPPLKLGVVPSRPNYASWQPSASLRPLTPRLLRGGLIAGSPRWSCCLLVIEVSYRLCELPACGVLVRPRLASGCDRSSSLVLFVFCSSLAWRGKEVGSI